MTYKEAVAYLDSLVNFEKAAGGGYYSSFKLERTRYLAMLCGDPHLAIPAVHVAGSKGKGSTATFIHSILREAGLDAGLYTSPHLISVRERIQMGGGPVTEEEFAGLISHLIPAIDEFLKARGDRPTYFEVCTMAAFLFFKEMRADIMVLETGLGGRLDSTNIVTPLVSVITSLSYEHTAVLGDRLQDIAFEKCGIIKRGVPAISAAQEDEAAHVIEKVAADRGAPLYIAGRDILFDEISSDTFSQSFDLKTPRAAYKGLSIKLLGSYQVENASLAAAAAEALRAKGFPVTDSSVRDGLANASWPGRLDVAARRPFIILDGAHNRASARQLRRAIEKSFPHRNLYLIIGMMSDKDITGICEELAPPAAGVYVTKSGSCRAEDPSRIKAVMERSGKSGAVIAPDISSALALARGRASSEDLILVTGSLYLVGEALRALNIRGRELSDITAGV